MNPCNLPARPLTSAVHASERSPPDRKRPILVVEDEPSILDNILYSLETEGFDPTGSPTGEAALAALRFLSNISTETERLQNIIDRLLALSAIESRKTLENPESVHLGKLVDALCATHQQAFEARRVTLRTCPEDLPAVQGEPFLLEIAINNLLQNALEFSPPGGTVTVRLRRRQDLVEVLVEDEGPGIPAYARERVFDRFYSLPRAGTGRKSFGLGLCFVKEAAELHGGSATLENLPGCGARAVLSLRPG